MLRAVNTSAAFFLTAVALASASVRLPLVEAAVASDHCLVISASPVFASANFSAVIPAGSFLACERMSTRLWIACTTLGIPVLISSHVLDNSAFFAATALASSLALAVTACASDSAALKSPLLNLSLAAASPESSALAWSGMYLLTSVLAVLTAASAALRAVSEGPLSGLPQAAIKVAAKIMMMKL